MPRIIPNRSGRPRALSILFGLSTLVYVAWPAVGQTNSQTAASTPQLAPQENATSQPTTRPSGPTPKLEVSTNEWDFGEKWAGQKAETAVTLKNVGDAVLKIEKVRRSCGCTVAEVKNKELKPGDCEELKIVYNTLTRKQNVSQSVRIESNDPDNPTTVITVKGKVKPVVKLDPERGLNLGKLGPKDTVKKSIEIECAYSEPLKLELDEARLPKHFYVRLETIEQGRKYRLTATTKSPLPDGLVRGVVRMLTGRESFPYVPVRVWANVYPSVSTSPRVLYVYKGSEKPETRYVQVTTRRNKPLTITGVSTSDPKIAARIVSATTPGTSDPETPAAARILVTLPAASELTQAGTITIQTDDEEYPELSVWVIKRSPPERRLKRSGGINIRPAGGATAGPKQLEKP